VQLLSEGILKELLSVEGRYIEWEWDPRTLTDDYIAMREPDGFEVAISNKDGLGHHLKVPLRALGVDPGKSRFRRSIEKSPRFQALSSERRAAQTAAVNVSKLDLRRSRTSKNSNKFNLQFRAVMTAAATKEALSMHAPIRIIFEGVVRSDAIEGCIRQEWEGLSDIGAPVTSSRPVPAPGPSYGRGRSRYQHQSRSGRGKTYRRNALSGS
jgi:hypothetical protein